MPKRQYGANDIAVIRNVVLDRLSNPSEVDGRAVAIMPMPYAVRPLLSEEPSLK